MAEGLLLDKLLTENGGIMMPYLMADLAAFLLVAYLITSIYPAIRSSLKFRNMTKEIGGPRGHWFFGDSVTVSNFQLLSL